MNNDDSVPGIAVGTIVARNYLPAARVFVESYLRHHPGAAVRVLVLDASGDMPFEPDGAGDVRLVTADLLDMSRDDFHRMAAAYTVTEFATALKPWLLRLLLTEFDTAMYLDPDIQVYAPFADEVATLAGQFGVVLTPHVTEPMPRDGLRPSEADIMASGVFNLGFVAVSCDGMPFLDFWAARLRHDALVAPDEQMFTDQRWVDNVPALFRHTVITDVGYNVAYWNAYQRPVRRSGAKHELTAGGKPLRFFHFSGYRPERPWLLSTHFADRPRVLLSDEPVIEELCARYRDRLRDAGYGETLESIPYGFAALPDGTPLSPSMRRTFRDAWVAAERDGTPLPPSPFADGGDTKFLAWAAEPADAAQRAAGGTRWSMAVWQARNDLRAAFPEPLGADAAAFRDWCATSGVAEGELHPAAIPEPPCSRTVAVADEPGVNVLGYLTAELGVGEMGRLVLDAVRTAALPVAAVVDDDVANRTAHPIDAGLLGDPRYPVSLLCVNADMTRHVLGLHPEIAEDRYVIGLWSWELSQFPQWMHAAFADVAEVWTISGFTRAAIAVRAPVPVRLFPVPVRDPYPDGVPPTRDSLGTTRFLFVFDYQSIFERKNPLAVVDAFTRAFDVDDDVELIIKSINGNRHPEDRERLRLAIADHPGIRLVEDYLSAAEMRQLFESADCYVSLHRAEGFGLTVAEAMAHGLPVIATDYSGSAEVLTRHTGWPIGYRLVPVGPACHPYPKDAEWAEPDVSAAAAAMREIVDDPAAAREVGRAARAHVLATRSRQAAADWVAARVAEARERWRATRTVADAPPAPPPGDFAGAREALRWRADTTAPSRMPLAPALRRAVLRGIDHYDHHQRTVLGAVVDVTETNLHAVAGHVAEVDRRQESEHRLLKDMLGEVRDAAAADRIAAHEAVAGEADRRSAEIARLDAVSREQAARLDTLERTLAQVSAERDRLDHKMMTLLSERDSRIDSMQRAVATAGPRLTALHTAIERHHELLTANPPDIATATVATDVGVLRLPADDTVVLPWMREYASWENEEATLVDHFLCPGGSFVDIGAHVGYFTVRALRDVGPTGAVFAVEPWATARELLARNAAANVPAATAAALTTLPVAAWDADESLALWQGEPGNSGDHRVGRRGGEPVDGVRLDGVPELRKRRIDVVKCDAQGQDHRALAGLSEVLTTDRPHVLCEFWPDAIVAAGGDPVAVVDQYTGWRYDPVPVSDEVVSDVLAGRDVENPLSAKELVSSARDSSSGFVTLWLRPQETVARR